MRRAKVLCTQAMDPSGVALLQQVAEVSVAPDSLPETLRALADTADFLVVRNQRAAGVVRAG